MNISHRFKYYLFLLLLLPCLVLTSCGKEEEAPLATPSAVVPEVASISHVTLAPLPVEDAQEALPDVSDSAIVSQSVGYYFPNVNGNPNLYAGFEVTNIGTIPIRLQEAKLSFQLSSSIREETFHPLESADDLILPGEKNVYAFWAIISDHGKDITTIPVDITLSVEGSTSIQSSRVLPTTDLRLIQNYPSFPTLSGSISNPSQTKHFSLYTLYAGMYDRDNKLLGVWMYTESQNIQAQSRISIINQVRLLPIPNLAENTNYIRARTIGYE